MNKKKIKQAVILAGGLGTRLAPFTNDNPKPMYPIQGKPYIEWLVNQVKDFGLDSVVLLLGYKAEKITEYLGDGSSYGVNISYDITPVEYNTADRIKHAQNLLQDNFMLMYCDNYCPIDFERHVENFFKNDADVQITVYSNKDKYTKDNLTVGDDSRVVKYDKQRKEEGLCGVDIGYAIVRKKVLSYIDTVGSNFEQIVYTRACQEGKLFATVTDHRYYSIGSYERIELTEKFFSNQSVVFLDRDGTINVRAPKACYIESPEQFVWLEGAVEAINILKKNGYKIILITNQPGIARGNITEEMLESIHNKMQSDLQNQIGVQIDDIYYCPHNWDEGCDCRKPKPGMLYQAQRDYSLNLTKCILVGDDDRDIEAGRAAGCICYQVDVDNSLLDIVNEKIICK